MIQGFTGWKIHCLNQDFHDSRINRIKKLNSLSESGFPGLKDLQDEENRYLITNYQLPITNYQLDN
jgi:hypothetical protein